MALLCHGKNLGWDRSLRVILYWVYLCAVIIFPVAILAYGIATKSDLNEALFCIVFNLPLIRYFLQQFMDNRISIKKVKK